MFMLTGLPVTGSFSSRTPSFTLNTPLSGASTYFKLAAGLGLRKTDTVGLALFSPQTGSRFTPVGSRTMSIVNSGVGFPSGGHGRPTRNRPRLSSKECDDSRSCGRLGLSEPSIAANSGSLPLVTRHRSRIRSIDRLIAPAGWWHVTQALPLGPSASKKACPLVATGPSALRMPSRPAALSNDISRGRMRSAPASIHRSCGCEIWACRAIPAAVTVAKKKRMTLRLFIELTQRARVGLPLRVGAQSARRADEHPLGLCAVVVQQLPLQPRDSRHAERAPIVFVVGSTMADGRIDAIEDRHPR